MLDSKNKIGNINNSNIGKIEQTNIEKQEINNKVNVIFANNNFGEIAISHELFPDFMVDSKKKLDGHYTYISKPLSKEATEKYPFNIKASIQITDKRFKDIKNPKELLDMLQYADSPVEIKVLDFEQYLGNVLDPYPDPDLSPVGKNVKTFLEVPKIKLPKVNLDMDIIFDNSKFALRNIKLKLTRRLSCTSFIFDNYSQKSKDILIQLEMDYKSKEDIKFNINYKLNPQKIKDSKAGFNFLNFIFNMYTNSFSFLDRNSKKIILSGKRKIEIDNNEIVKIKNNLILFRAIIEIEKFFNIKFEMSYEMSNKDVNKIMELYKKITECKNRIKAKGLSFQIMKKDVNIDWLKQLIQMKSIDFIMPPQDIEYNILGKNIKLCVEERYDPIKCSNVNEINVFINNYDEFDEDYLFNVKMISSRGKNFYKYTNIIKK